MNPLREKLSELLTDSTRRGIKTLDPNSSCAKLLENLDIDDIVKEDIRTICETVSYTDIVKIIFLSSRLKMMPVEKRKPIKGKLKEIAVRAVEKTEKKHGKLRIPDPCRHLLLSL